jgi:hypothetical protein
MQTCGSSSLSKYQRFEFREETVRLQGDQLNVHDWIGPSSSIHMHLLVNLLLASVHPTGGDEALFGPCSNE